MGINWLVFEQSCKKRLTFLREKFPKFANLPQNVVKLPFPTEDEMNHYFFQKEGMISGTDHHLLFFFVMFVV